MAVTSAETLKPSTAQEALVVVPEECYEQCKRLPHEMGMAAMGQLAGTLDAVVCDDESRRHSFPKHCPAVRAHFKLIHVDGRASVSPMIVGEHHPLSWIDRIEAAIEENGGLTLTDAAKKLGMIH